MSMFDLAADLLDGGGEQSPDGKRDRLVADHPTALDLAQRFDHTTVRTPALEHLADELHSAVVTRGGRLVVSIPPQEGKSTLLQWLCVWLLARRPSTRIVYASYALKIARRSGRAVRTAVRVHGREVGLALDRSAADASDWQLDGHGGGMVSVGVGGALTGRPADVLIVDDPLRGQAEADSDTIRGALHDWWSTVARTRLSSGAVVIVVQTRWHEDDLAGRRIAEGWPLVNIPALADGTTPDALDRAPGEYLRSAQGRTVAEWEATRADVGERTWAALYQGSPSPAEGGTFKAAWFDTWRLPDPPAGCAPPTVYVDPADNDGSGDEAGIIVATKHLATGRAVLLDDLSAPMTVAVWARLALLTCARRGAPRLAYERSLSQLGRRIREAWDVLHAQARALDHAGYDHDAALARLVRAEDGEPARNTIRAQLAELTEDDVAEVLGMGPVGPAVHTITARGSKELRMQLVAPTFETGRAVLVGRFPKLEHQAATWQVGQDSPDRVDAMVHAVTDLLGMSAPASATRPGRTTRRIPARTSGQRIPAGPTAATRR